MMESPSQMTFKPEVLLIMASGRGLMVTLDSSSVLARCRPRNLAHSHHIFARFFGLDKYVSYRDGIGLISYPEIQKISCIKCPSAHFFNVQSHAIWVITKFYNAWIYLENYRQVLRLLWFFQILTNHYNQFYS